MNWFPGSGCGRSVLVHWRKSSCVFVARAHCCLKKNWSQDEKGTFHSGLALSVIVQSRGSKNVKSWKFGPPILGHMHTKTFFCHKRESK